MSKKFNPCTSCVGCTFRTEGSCVALTEPALNKLGLCKFRQTSLEKKEREIRSEKRLFGLYNHTEAGKKYLDSIIEKYYRGRYVSALRR